MKVKNSNLDNLKGWKTVWEVAMCFVKQMYDEALDWAGRKTQNSITSQEGLVEN